MDERNEIAMPMVCFLPASTSSSLALAHLWLFAQKCLQNLPFWLIRSSYKLTISWCSKKRVDEWRVQWACLVGIQTVHCSFLAQLPADSLRVLSFRFISQIMLPTYHRFPPIRKEDWRNVEMRKMSRLSSLAFFLPSTMVKNNQEFRLK